MDKTSLMKVISDLRLSLRRFDFTITSLFKSCGLSGNTFRVLMELHCNPDGIEPAAIADATNLVRPAVTQLLNDLESSGLIERREHAADHRRKIVTLTPRGQALAAETLEKLTSIEQRTLNRFSDDDLNCMCRVFDSYTRTLEQEFADEEKKSSK
ncbi:MAG: MarR family transcriptional regulator [Victivallaceae bacterium]|nr:MarR family transcriptional regulator [Victivallaceae bacterium]